MATHGARCTGAANATRFEYPISLLDHCRQRALSSGADNGQKNESVHRRPGCLIPLLSRAGIFFSEHWLWAQPAGETLPPLTSGLHRFRSVALSLTGGISKIS